MGSEELEAPLLPQIEGGLHEPPTLVSRTWTESKKLWQIVAPAIFSRLTMYGINVISQAFAGHLGDLELASVSIATTVIVGLNFGLLLGMASALETLCGQAYGAKKYHMLGVYMQRSWIILSACALLLLPVYVFAEPILLLFGQPRDIAAMTGSVAVWFIPQHFSFVFMFPLQRFLQCQLKNGVTAYASAAALAFHVVASYLLIVVWRLGIVGIAVSLNLSWWVSPAVMFLYVTLSPGCARSWTGFSVEAFSGLWEFLKLSAASGVMLCLENWYYRVLVLLAGNMKNAQVAVDALSICMSINGWELMIPFAFFAGTGVRVANELGAGNGKGARFATVVSVVTSSVIGLFFWALIVAFHDKFALIFTSSVVVLKAVDKLSILLAFTILLNSVQPILSGVAVGSGWQTVVAYVNIGSYYMIGVPLGVLLGWVFHLDVLGLWAGMIGGTAVQTLILTIFTVRCDWEKEAMKASTRVDKWETRK